MIRVSVSHAYLTRVAFTLSLYDTSQTVVIHPSIDADAANAAIAAIVDREWYQIRVQCITYSTNNIIDILNLNKDIWNATALLVLGVIKRSQSLNNSIYGRNLVCLILKIEYVFP